MRGFSNLASRQLTRTHIPCGVFEQPLVCFCLFFAVHGKSSQVLNPPSWRNHTGTTIVGICAIPSNRYCSWFGMMRFLWDR